MVSDLSTLLATTPEPATAVKNKDAMLSPGTRSLMQGGKQSPMTV